MNATEYIKQRASIQKKINSWFDKMVALEDEYRKNEPYPKGSHIIVRFKEHQPIKGVVTCWEIDNNTGEFRPNMLQLHRDGTTGKHLYYPWEWKIVSINIIN